MCEWMGLLLILNGLEKCGPWGPVGRIAPKPLFPINEYEGRQQQEPYG